MKVLMIARTTLYSSPGGDTVQINNTALFLRKLGVLVDIILAGSKMNYEEYDLVHFFNIIRPDDIIPYLKKAKLPVAVSTIFVDYSEYEKRNRQGVAGLLNKIFSNDQIEYIKVVARFLKNGDKINSLYYLLNGHTASVKYVAGRAGILLPNSHSEYERLVKRYGGNYRYKKVVNAIDPTTFNGTVVPNEQFRDHILSVGRIEGRKNQLNLIKAVAGTDLKLTIIGKPSPNHIDYYNECRQLALNNNNIQIIEHLSHDELKGVYKAAKVHVLPSWFETTGLSSLEAAAMDCNIVVTRKGDTEEYFGAYAYYCEPDDIQSIRLAVQHAYEAPVDPSFREYIFSSYTWEQAAAQTLEAYKEILNK